VPFEPLYCVDIFGTIRIDCGMFRRARRPRKKPLSFMTAHFIRRQSHLILLVADLFHPFDDLAVEFFLDGVNRPSGFWNSSTGIP
jgi:hypothetical protein